MIYTTLEATRKHDPCESGWKILLAGLGKTESDNEPLSLQTILEINGIRDAVWAMRCIEGMDGPIRELACRFAESVLPIYEAKYPWDKRPRSAIAVTRRYAHGEATDEELQSASDAARSAARTASRDAARSAAWDAAWFAASAATSAVAGEDACDSAWSTWDAASLGIIEKIFINWLNEFCNEEVK